MIVAGVWTCVGFSNLKNCRTWIRTRIQKFWNKSGVGVWQSDSGHLCSTPQRWARIMIEAIFSRIETGSDCSFFLIGRSGLDRIEKILVHYMKVMYSRPRPALKLRDRHFIKIPYSRLETWNSRPRLESSKFVHFADIFPKTLFITSKLNFFQISAIFLARFGCFLPANTTNKKSLNHRNFTIPFLRYNQSLETCILRDRDMTWNLRARDWQK